MPRWKIFLTPWRADPSIVWLLPRVAKLSIQYANLCDQLSVSSMGPVHSPVLYPTQTPAVGTVLSPVYCKPSSEPRFEDSAPSWDEDKLAIRIIFYYWEILRDKSPSSAAVLSSFPGGRLSRITTAERKMERWRQISKIGSGRQESGNSGTGPAAQETRNIRWNNRYMYVHYFRIYCHSTREARNMHI